MATERSTSVSRSWGTGEQAGQRRRANLRSEAWLYGDWQSLKLMAPHFETLKWRVTWKTSSCFHLESPEACVPDIAGLVREYPNVTVLARLYDRLNDDLTIIAESQFICAKAVETMQVFSHADYYGVPKDANMFDY